MAKDPVLGQLDRSPGRDLLVAERLKERETDVRDYRPASGAGERRARPRRAYLSQRVVKGILRRPRRRAAPEQHLRRTSSLVASRPRTSIASRVATSARAAASSSPAPRAPDSVDGVLLTSTITLG